MIRRISTKLVLAVLTAVVLPFVAFVFFINEQMADRLTRHVVQQALKGLAKELGGQLDAFVDERNQDLDHWAGAPLTNLAIDNYLMERRRLQRILGDPVAGVEDVPVWNATTMRIWAGGSSAEIFDFQWRAQLTAEFDRFLRLERVYDLLLLVAEDGGLVTCNSRDASGAYLEKDDLIELFERDFLQEDWFRLASRGEFVRLDQHESPFRRSVELDPDRAEWNYHVAFATPVQYSSEGVAEGGVRGVLFALVNWAYIQELVTKEVVKDAFRGLVTDKDPSPYAWVWAHDAETILAHPARSLYKKSIVHDIRLPQLTQAVKDNTDGWGLFPEYRFDDKNKNAAFIRCLSQNGGGFGWVVGVGIDNDDIYATADELRAVLLGGAAVVVAMAVLWTLFIARRTTGPVLQLQRYTRRVAEGDLDARIEIRSRDELGALADDFNRMTRDLKEQRERIVKAEKDAAWREMARQIAHDIKNPLTPISLSLDLLERARREQAQGSEEILERTMGLIRKQVDNLRQIAGDFYEFTGGHKPKPERLDVGTLLQEVLHLHDAWAVELGVEIQREGPELEVYADRGKLLRVLVNLVSNGLQAMPEGGRLQVETRAVGNRAVIRLRDTGTGIAEDVREHLFEPYFTTKSEGTGLGLAISKQVVEQMNGTITLEPAPDGIGSVATVSLPVPPGGPSGTSA